MSTSTLSARLCSWEDELLVSDPVWDKQKPTKQVHLIHLQKYPLAVRGKVLGVAGCLFRFSTWKERNTDHEEGSVGACGVFLSSPPRQGSRVSSLEVKAELWFHLGFTAGWFAKATHCPCQLLSLSLEHVSSRIAYTGLSLSRWKKDKFNSFWLADLCSFLIFIWIQNWSRHYALKELTKWVSRIQTTWGRSGINLQNFDKIFSPKNEDATCDHRWKETACVWVW